MSTPAARRFARVTAQQASAETSAGQAVRGTEYELMLAKLYDDKRRLKEVQSVARKIEIKREILPDYDSWIHGALAGGQGGQDDVLVTVMVWKLDIGDFDGAIQIAQYVIHHDLVMPDAYERSAATVLVDEIADAALRVQKSGESFGLESLRAVMDLTIEHDMPDQARAKLHKALGYEYQESGQLVLALEEYEAALQFNARIGVKRLIDDIKKELVDQA